MLTLKEDIQTVSVRSLPNDSDSENEEMKPLVTDKIVKNKSLTFHIYPETRAEWIQASFQEVIRFPRFHRRHGAPAEDH